MPKNLVIDPAERRAPGTLKFKDIQLNRYKKTMEQESKVYSKKQLLGIYRDMYAIREFEIMLTKVKKEGTYAGKEFTYPGPSHLSIGQEATAVGQAFILGIDDFIFGSHRSHGEILAKGFSAIAKLSEAELDTIMKDFMGGKQYDVVMKHTKHKRMRDVARDFLLYGAMAEIFAKDNGFNRGLGGSMHAFFLPFGIYPNNAIVGGSAPMALGVALYKKCNQKKGIVIANAGDGAAGRGPVMESLNFAAMDQFTQLWEEGYKGGLPILFNFNNNNYGMGGQTKGETMAYGILARMGAGVSPTQLHAERVDGYNPLAVIDAMKRKKKILEAGEGPVLLDVLTYRLTGHSTSDVESYRTKEELDSWAAVDPIIAFAKELVDANVCTEAEIEKAKRDATQTNHDMFYLASDLEVSPYVDFKSTPYFVEDVMFSNDRVEKMDDREPVTLMPKADNPRAQQIATRVRYGYDANGKPVPKTKVYNIRDGIFEAIFDKFYTDPTLVAYGEDVRHWNGAFAVYRGLTEALPHHRLFNSPISESAIVGSAVGYGVAGGRVIVELMYADFIGCAGDEIFNQLAKWQAMSAGLLKMPVVLRVSVGSKYGAQHSQDWTALTAHIPGLKVVFPVTPYDCKGLMNTALMGTDPVIFCESQRIYDMGEMFHEGGVPEGYYEIPFGEPDVKKAGNDVTILTIGATLYRVLDAAKELESKYGVSAEVIDARSVVPFNYDKVIESVKKTGRIVLASDACTRGNIMNDMAQNITQLAFDYLDAPPVVVGAENWITPAFEYDAQFFPQQSWILDAIHEKLLPLQGYTATHSYTNEELLRKARKGV